MKKVVLKTVCLDSNNDELIEVIASMEKKDYNEIINRLIAMALEQCIPKDAF